MNLNNQTKTLLLIAGIVLVILFVFKKDNSPLKNEGELNEIDVESDEEQLPMEEAQMEELPQEYNPMAGMGEMEMGEIQEAKIKQKFKQRNKARDGEYKRVSFSGDSRGNMGPSEWDDFFNNQNNLIGDSQKGSNADFLPMEAQNSQGLAGFNSTGKQACGLNDNCSPEELFDADKYLPQEVNDDWFETQPEPVSVKNRHLINVTKPIGINTIGSSNKNQSYDIRGTPACPKFAVSPWLQSAIEPDVNLKPLV